MKEKRKEGEGSLGGWSSDGVSRLVRLKRHECPEGGYELYIEKFVEEFRERQRAELLRTSARGLLWERLATYVGAGCERRQGHLAWGGLGLAAAACAAFLLVFSGGKQGVEVGDGGAMVAEAIGVAGDGVRDVAALMAASGEAREVVGGAGVLVPVADGGMGVAGSTAMYLHRGLNYSMGWEAGLGDGMARVVPCEWGIPGDIAGRGRGVLTVDGEIFGGRLWDEEEWRELARDLLEGMGERRDGGAPWADGE
jgi:hypothetical protein